MAGWRFYFNRESGAGWSGYFPVLEREAYFMALCRLHPNQAGIIVSRMVDQLEPALRERCRRKCRLRTWPD